MKLITANGKQILRMTKDEWIAIGLKFEEAKKKKKKGLGRGPCGKGMARGRGGNGGGGAGYGKGNATGPRAKEGTCPKQ